MKSLHRPALFALLLAMLLCHIAPAAAQTVETSSGRVAGVALPGGIRAFKGIPYAAPPVEERRWKPPQPAADWQGVRRADRFGPRCMQPRLYGDMIFRSAGMSEDCLYLNVWTPQRALAPQATPQAAPRDSARSDTTRGDTARSDTARSDGLPVLVYFYGGGFRAGDGSEPRYDGASMAQQGLVVVTLNYRLGVFGFMAHPGLTREQPRGASGNYGLLDQAQALRWVEENIAAFGGDPGRITIAGESAGSFSVSAHLASPLSKGLVGQAIGESGAMMGRSAPLSLAEAERRGAQFAEAVGAESVSALRALSSTRLLELSLKPGRPSFEPVVDGHFLERSPLQVYQAGEQARVPLLVGWNSEEANYRALLGSQSPTPANYAQAVRERYGNAASEALKHYRAETWEDVIEVGTALAGDHFIGFGTWKWSELHRQTGAPVYRYFYTHPRPPMKEGESNAIRGLAGPNEGAGRITPPRGAVHSAEIEYALGNLQTNDIYAWTPADYEVSRLVQTYFANFVKRGDPNGAGLPTWPAAGTGEQAMLMRLALEPEATREEHRARYRFLDRVEGE